MHEGIFLTFPFIHALPSLVYLMYLFMQKVHLKIFICGIRNDICTESWFWEHSWFLNEIVFKARPLNAGQFWLQIVTYILLAPLVRGINAIVGIRPILATTSIIWNALWQLAELRIIHHIVLGDKILKSLILLIILATFAINVFRGILNILVGVQALVTVRYSQRY